MTTTALLPSRRREELAIRTHCPYCAFQCGIRMADTDGESVVCPYHAFRFDADTGECDQPGICSIATYPVEETDAGIVVTI